MVKDSYTEDLAELAVGTDRASIPDHVLAGTKLLLTDTLGCAVGGWRTTSSQIAARVMTRGSGPPESTVLVSGSRVASNVASFINAHFGNALDADDTLLSSGHLASSTIAPALAVAEQMGGTGEELLTAITVGYEVAGRIAVSMRTFEVNSTEDVEIAELSSVAWSAFGGAVAAGRLLGLNVDQMVDAFGITAWMLPLPTLGRWAVQRSPRPMTKYAMHGALAEVGVRAAMFAREGFTADRSVFDGDRGLWRLSGAVECDWDVLEGGIEGKWMVEEASYKLYPACNLMQAPLDLFYQLKEANGLAADEIEAIEIGLVQSAVAHSMGEAVVRTSADGQFNMAYLLACAALAGPPGPAWHSDDALRNPDIARFASKISVREEPGSSAIATADLLAGRKAKRQPCSIRVTARGEVFTAKAEYSRGDPHGVDGPLSGELVKTKFRSFCAESLRPEGIEGALSVIEDLDTEGTVDRLMAHLIC
jgi:2-methylcitrate dehydratase PrpD